MRAHTIMQSSRSLKLQKDVQDVKYHRHYVDSSALEHTEETIHVVNILAKCLKVRDCWQTLLNPDKFTRDMPMPVVPSLQEFNNDLRTLWYNICSGRVTSYAWKRLQLLEQKYKFHILLNSGLERKSSNRSYHRDFYDVATVDNHIHLSGAFTTKFVGDFLNDKVIHDGTRGVYKTKEGKIQTLNEVVEEVWSKKGMQRGSRFTVDDMGSLSETNMFRRFDVFNNSYNVCGSKKLREILFKPSGLNDGKYLAEITKLMFNKIEKNRFNNYIEPRVSIYGKNKNEWENLSNWMFDNDLIKWSGWKTDQKCVWLIQIPRIYRFLKAGGSVETFEECIRNIFDPIIEATENPHKHEKLAKVLRCIVAFDSVDDESLPESFTSDKDPATWDTSDSPPYSYQLYHIFKELVRVNHLRRRKGLNVFAFRPHTGEAGPTHHLGTAFLLATSINHGITLRKEAGMQYLYYLSQIGMAMSPYSNNVLFRRLSDNPFPTFFHRGLHVSLTTDDPLQFHISSCPLLEEYTTARQLWMLSTTDLCEISRNSVEISGLSDLQKRSLIGKNHKKLPSFEGHDASLTNVSDVRAAYRWETLLEELSMLKSIATKSKLLPKSWKCLIDSDSESEFFETHTELQFQREKIIRDHRRVSQYVDIALKLKTKSSKKPEFSLFTTFNSSSEEKDELHTIEEAASPTKSTQTEGKRDQETVRYFK